MPRIGLKAEEKVWTSILEEFAKKPDVGNYHLRLSVPYTNWNKFLRKVMLKKHHAKIDILTTAPESSAYFGDKTIKGRFPNCYRRNLTQILLINKKLGNDVKAFEYIKGATRRAFYSEKVEYRFTTFHFKGYWITNPGDEFPADFSFGSSSYDKRSFEKDYEVNFYMSTADKEF
jgi:phosphatidylserine/phosphatidylglycerophosphate/cardiolipin synthase-like enzyme